MLLELILIYVYSKIILQYFSLIQYGEKNGSFFMAFCVRFSDREKEEMQVSSAASNGNGKYCTRMAGRKCTR